MKALAALSLVLTLSGCSWIGNAAKEGVIQAAGYSSWSHFNLTGEIPRDYSFQYTAYYEPDGTESCTFFSVGLGSHVSRRHIKQARTKTATKTKDFSYRVPLAYHEAGCEMQLQYVGFQIFANWGQGDSEFGRDLGALGISDSLPESVPHLPLDGRLELRGKCMWLFRLMGKDNYLAKGLVCHKADTDWQVPEDYSQRIGIGASVRREELTGRTIHVAIRPSEEERPYYRGTWLHTEAGWRPCIETSEFLRCQNPPSFRSFRMNDRECTVYPNCTE